MRSKSLLLLVALAACGGDGAADPAATANPDSTAAAAAAAAGDSGKKFTHAKPKAPMVDTGTVATPQSLVRETYGYSFTTASRDPFRGLVVVAVEGPELPDLVLVGLVYDRNQPNNSLATFLDVQNKKRYNVRPGDRIGRLQFTTVDEKGATLRVNDFGTMRQQVYELRKGEGNL